MNMYSKNLSMVFLFLFGSAAWGQSTESRPPTDDSYINANNPNVNFGASGRMVVHSYGPKQALFRFEIPGIDGTTVTEATLDFGLDQLKNPGQISIYEVTSIWSESTVTWNNQPTFGATSIADIDLSDADIGTVISIDVTPTAQKWADGSLPQAGFLITSNEDIRANFDTKESGQASQPMIRFQLENPPPGTGTGTGTPPTVLNLSSPPIIIDEPGHYVLDQNWTFEDLEMNSTLINIQANVTLDLNGFEISTGEIGLTVIQIDSFSTIMNGSIFATGDAASAITSSTGARIQNLTVHGNEDGVGIDLAGSSTVMNVVVNDGGIRLDGDESSLLSSVLSCAEPCIIVRGSKSTVSGNKVSQFSGTRVISLEGDGNLFTHNTVEFYEPQAGILVSGNSNLVLSNTIVPLPSASGTYLGGVPLRVDGTRNTLKDNILPPQDFEVSTGIQFTQDGNFYRNNQISATTPFDLGGTSQTDMGGNSAF